MNYKLIKEKVNNSYKKISSIFNSKTLSHKHDLVAVQNFAHHFPTGSRILDVGCGTGEISSYLSNSFELNIEGIDLSADMLLQAKKNHKNIPFTLMDICSLKFADNFFDGVVSNFSLIHIPKNKIPLALSEIKRVLKNNGYALITIQEGASTEGFYSVPYDPGVKMYLNIMTELEIGDFLKDASYKIINTSYRLPQDNEFAFKKLSILVQK